MKTFIVTGILIISTIILIQAGHMMYPLRQNKHSTCYSIITPRYVIALLSYCYITKVFYDKTITLYRNNVKPPSGSDNNTDSLVSTRELNNVTMSKMKYKEMADFKDSLAITPCMVKCQSIPDYDRENPPEK